MFNDFHLLNQSVIILNNKHNVVFVNKAYLKLSGKNEDELINKKYQSLCFYEDEFKDYQIDFKECLINGGEIQRQVFIEDKNKTMKAVFVTFTDVSIAKEHFNMITLQDLSQIIKCEYYLNQSEISKNKSCAFEGLIGCHDLMREIYRLLELAADSDVNILISGESGTGKEMIAKAVHHLSKRNDYPFIAVNCSALSESLLESELFGHVKGAFTGAMKDKIGKFEAAQGGTIFLDEIAEISPLLQVKLLRVLQERSIEKVGDNKTVNLDIRILAATNKNLKDEVKAGGFREDLFYRLNVFPIQTIALRQRKTDIPLLISHFIEILNKRTGKKISRLSQSALSLFMDFDWPGNVRQLENMIEYAFVLTNEELIDLRHLPRELTMSEKMVPAKTIEKKATKKRVNISKPDLLSLLARHNNNRIKTAEYLGISKVSLWKKMKKFELL
jgi:two-component system, NtrC family, response regulator HydG